VRKVGTIAGRELRSLFVSPVAYVVLTLWALLGAFFFLSAVAEFQQILMRLQQFQAFDRLRDINLNDDLITPFFATMWIFLLIGVPAVTMGLFASEKANRTEELLLTSPVTIWEIVLGKYLAVAVFVTLMTVLVGFFPGLLFVYGDPELGKTAAGLLGLLLMSLSYAAMGAFASALTASQIIAFFVALIFIVIFVVLSLLANLAASQGLLGGGAWVGDLMRWLATLEHFYPMTDGLVETADLVYFAAVTASFLLLAKAAVESVRWR